MFVEGIPSLIGLTMAVSLLTLDSLKGSRSAVAIKKGILGFIATLASRNFVTRLIMSDGEGAVGQISEELNLLGMEVDISGAGGHQCRPYRKKNTDSKRESQGSFLTSITVCTDNTWRGYAGTILRV